VDAHSPPREARVVHGIQLNASEIVCAAPLRGPPSAQRPAWLSSPDPNWYPNGIGDAMPITAQVYAQGFTCPTSPTSVR
jgi:hypothetical protein